MSDEARYLDAMEDMGEKMVEMQARIQELTNLLYEIDGASMSQFHDAKHMADWIKQEVRRALHKGSK
jgi:hypothetical protein